MGGEKKRKESQGMGKSGDGKGRGEATLRGREGWDENMQHLLTDSKSANASHHYQIMLSRSLIYVVACVFQ